MSSRGEAVVEATRSETGDDVRSVLEYSPNDWEMLFVREGVVESYEEWQLDAAARDARLESRATEFVDQLYPEHGGLVCNVKWFPRAVEVNLTFEEGWGTLIAVDRSHFDDASNGFVELVDALGTYADGEV